MTADRDLAPPASVPRPARIVSVDIVRGVAVLGILLLNIVDFALPQAAYVNPAADGGAHGIDLATWAVEFVLVDGKMRGLFSCLFGASLLLVAEAAEAGGRHAARLHGARMFWLLLFGLAHFWLLWDGDILHHYALVGTVAFLWRRAPVERLVATGICLLLAQWLVAAMLPIDVALAAQAAAMPHPPPGAIAAVARYRQAFGIPDAAALAADLALHRGGYAGLVAARWQAGFGTMLSTLTYVGLETLSYMLLGMAALRSGLLTGDWPTASYRRWARIGFVAGSTASTILAALLIAGGFPVGAVTTVAALTVPIRPVMIAAWACAIVAAGSRGGWLAVRLAAAGRMAFTNYLASSAICTTLFYGYGLGLFGTLSRTALLPVVAALWLLMLGWSQPWLTRFRYGPLEWLWRSLSRGRLQSMRIAAETRAVRSR